MRKLAILFLLVTAAFSVSAQCGPTVPAFNQSGHVYTAATAGQSDVVATFNAEIASGTAADGDIIVIPPTTSAGCPLTGTTAQTFAFTHSVTIQGAGAISATAGGISTTGTDNTIIYDHFTGVNLARWIFKCAGGKSCRITGISVYEDSTSANENKGLFVLINSAAGVTTWRADHLHFKINSGFTGIYVGGTNSGFVQGVADHNFFEPGVGQTHGLTNNYAMHNGYGYNGTTISTVNASWAAGPNFGGTDKFFIEDNYVHNTDVIDASEGSRYVVRNNNVVCDVAQTSGCQLFSHTTREGERGDAYREVYNNTFSGLSGTNNTAVPVNTGVALAWGNILSNAYSHVLQVDNERTNYSDFVFQSQPTGLGYCGPTPYAKGTVNVTGTAVTWVSGPTFDTSGSWLTHVAAIIIDGANGLPPGASCTHTGANQTNSTTCPIASINSSTSITLAGTGSSTTVTGGVYQMASTLDGNATVAGYPCLDQPGRAQGDLLAGSPGNSNFLNTAVGNTQTWPHQPLTPLYVWGNVLNTPGSSPSFVSNADTTLYQDNREYFVQYGTYGETGSNCTTSPCNITAGINQTNRAPVNSTDLCPVNIDPMTGNPVSGVGWWNTANNTLYTCGSTANTWNATYTPAAYPSVYAGGGPTVATPTFSPAPGGSAAAQTVTISDATSGAVICYRLDGVAPTAIINGICDSNGGAEFTYTAPITIASSLTLTAIGTLTGNVNSAVASGNYFIGVAPAAVMFGGH